VFSDDTWVDASPEKWFAERGGNVFLGGTAG